MPPYAPFTLVKKSFAFGGTALTFLFGALIFSKDAKELPPTPNPPPAASPTPLQPAMQKPFPAPPAMVTPERQPSQSGGGWGSFLTGLFGGSKLPPAQPPMSAPIVMAPAPVSVSTNAVPTPPSPPAMLPVQQQQEGKRELWRNLHDKYEGHFYEAVRNGDTEAADKFSKLMIEAKNRK